MVSVMPEAATPQPEPVDWHAERRAEIEADQGRVSSFMARAEVTGVFDPAPGQTELNQSSFARGVRAEGSHRTKRRAPAYPGLEAGAISGRDMGRILDNEAAQAQTEPIVLSEVGTNARQEARRVAHAARYKNFLNTILDLPQSQQEARIKAWEEKNPLK